MSGSDRGVPGPAGHGIEHDAAVSEIIGAVLLIALVVAGATMVGVALFSQPFPTQTPKMTFLAGSDEYGTLIVYHTGGEELKSGAYRIWVNGTVWPADTIYNYPNLSSPAGNWTIGQGLAQGSGGGWKLDTAEYAENVTVEYFGGGAGNVSIATVRSNKTSASPEGTGFGFFSALYEHLFPGGGNESIVPLPSREGPHYPSVPSWGLANMSPQINFQPAAGVAYIYKDTSSPDYTPVQLITAGNPGTLIQFSDVNTINDALVNYGTVYILSGTYECNGPIRCSQSYRILQGYTPGGVDIPMDSGGYNDGYIKVSASNVIIKGLNLYGTGGVMIVASNVSVQNVTVTSRQPGEALGQDTPPGKISPINGMFFVWADGQDLENIEFYNCTASDCTTHGWNMNQNWDATGPHSISNTRFVNCRASYCGYGTANYGNGDGNSRSEWITGFDLHEWQDLIDCHVYNCMADNNWESGFHFEPGARYGDNGEDIGIRTRSEDVTLDNCTSIDNGRSKYPSKFFLSGYYLSRNTTLTNCFAANNTNAGFYVHGGNNADFENCTAVNNTKAGFLVIKGSSDITINNCIARDSPGYALWAAFTDNLQVKNFLQDNVTGGTGLRTQTQSILGWYKDDSRYGLPVTNSHFQINSTNSNVTIINRAGGGNTYDLTPP